MSEKIEGYIENIKDREKDNSVIFSIRVRKADVEKHEEAVTEALGDIADAVRELADAKKYLEKKQKQLKKIEKTGDKDDIIDARADVREAYEDVKYDEGFDMNAFYEEWYHFKQTGIPRCQTCKKDFIKEDEHIWRPICKCNPDIRLSIG